jgi:hypothetical protein
LGFLNYIVQSSHSILVYIMQLRQTVLKEEVQEYLKNTPKAADPFLKRGHLFKIKITSRRIPMLACLRPKSNHVTRSTIFEDRELHTSSSCTAQLVPTWHPHTLVCYSSAQFNHGDPHSTANHQRGGRLRRPHAKNSKSPHWDAGLE